MNTPGKRLEYAIFKKGYESVAAFASAVGEKPVTVRQQISRGTVPNRVAEKYTRRLKVPLDWLLYAKGPNPFSQELSTEKVASPPSSSAEVQGLSPRMKVQAEEQASDGNNKGNTEVMERAKLSELSLMLGGAPAEIVKDVYDYLKFKLESSTPHSPAGPGQKSGPR